jgi:hypothetical protein
MRVYERRCNTVLISLKRNVKLHQKFVQSDLGAALRYLTSQLEVRGSSRQAHITSNTAQNHSRERLFVVKHFFIRYHVSTRRCVSQRPFSEVQCVQSAGEVRPVLE